MRVLVSSSPGVGHLLPLLPVARAAAEHGHDVRVGVGASLAPIVERAGLSHVALGPPSLDVVRPLIPGFAAANRSEWPVLMLRHAFGGIVAAGIADAVAELAKDWRPDVIVHEDLELGSWIAAEPRGIPHVTIQATAWRPKQRGLVVDGLNEIRRRHGLPIDPELTGRDGRLWFTTRPPALRDPGQPMPEPLGELRPAPDDTVGGDAVELPPWLVTPTDRPRIAVTLGTVNSHRVDLFRPILEALAELDVDAVVGLGADPSTLGHAPANVRVERYVPMSKLLPRSALAIHHAGAGTTLAALAAGIPSVLLPIAADQFENATAVERTGAGVALGTDALEADDVATAVARILDDRSFVERAQSIHEEIEAMPDARAAWAEIEAIV